MLYDLRPKTKHRFLAFIRTSKPLKLGHNQNGKTFFQGPNGLSSNPFFPISSHGYTPFFQAIQPQLNSLRTFLLSQSTKTVIGQPPLASPTTPQLTSPSSSLFMRRSSPSSAPGSTRTSPMQEVHHKLSSQSFPGKSSSEMAPNSGKRKESGKTSIASAPGAAQGNVASVPEAPEETDEVENENPDAGACLIM